MFFQSFFINKMREVRSFLQIMKGKVKGNPEERIRGVDNALESMKGEQKAYEQELNEALKESEKERDVSAI